MVKLVKTLAQCLTPVITSVIYGTCYSLACCLAVKYQHICQAQSMVWVLNLANLKEPQPREELGRGAGLEASQQRVLASQMELLAEADIGS